MAAVSPCVISEKNTDSNVEDLVVNIDLSISGVESKLDGQTDLHSR